MLRSVKTTRIPGAPTLNFLRPQLACSTLIALVAAVAIQCSHAESLQLDDPAQLSVERIFGEKDFRTKSFGPFKWLDQGDAYTSLEELEENSGTSSENAAKQETTHDPHGKSADEEEPKPRQQLLRYGTQTGEYKVLVTAEQLTPPGADQPLSIDNYEWSEQKTKLLLFTNTVQVWRRNTKGDYWVLDLKSDTLQKVAADADESTLMFAKFSPSGDQVAYVRENNIYIENLNSGQTIAITEDGTKKLINGTFDWVYEEELDLRDGFRWSPDGQQIAYWQLDSNGIEDFYMINNTDELYPQLTPLPYPKAGTTNSACRIGVAPATGGVTTWMNIPGEPRENYLASMEWLADSSGLLIEQLNRLQNKRSLWKTEAGSGNVNAVFTDEDQAWIDVRQKFEWYESDTHRLVLSERDGWRHLYQVRLSDGDTKLLTPGDYDVIDLIGMHADDESSSETLFFTASPESAIHQYLYRVPLAGGPATRVTPDSEQGFHRYKVSPNGKWAVHTSSAMGRVPVVDLVSLPSHESIRTLQANEETDEQLAKLQRGEHEFFKMSIDVEGRNEPLQIDAWMMLPPDFDRRKKYPILFYVYTEPWGQTVRDVWGSDRYLWHLMLNQRGYIVASMDNRGTPAPRGRAWRKSIYRKIGTVNIQDQAAAARNIVQLPFVDEDRVGVWGWSGGGSATLNAMFQYPDVYHTGISVAPIGDLKLYDTIYQERYMGLPKDNVEGYQQGSAVTHAKHLAGNLLLIHGTADDNVHYQNAEVVINELIKHKRPFDMMSYPNRAHGISKGKGTRVHLFELMTRYLSENLPAGGK
jgi:dipeptidyl-peptidase-4